MAKSFSRAAPLGTLLVQLVHPKGDFQHPQLLPQGQVGLGLFRLGLQGGALELQFLQFVPNPQQVLLGALQFSLGLLLLVAAMGDPRRLLEDFPPLGAFGRENLINFSLPNEGIPLLAQPRVHEKFIDIPQADSSSIDGVFTFSGPIVPAGHRHLLPTVGQQVLALLQGEGHLGKALTLAVLGAAEDHILHLTSPQGPGGLLPQHPADGIGQIGLAAAVGPHDCRDGMGKGEEGFVRKGFEPLQFQGFQPQGTLLLYKIA